MAFLKAIWKNSSKHKKLYDEWALAGHNETEQVAENLAEEESFRVKYAGSTLVEKPSSEEATADAVKTILTMSKASGKKCQRVNVAVSLKGIKVIDVATEETQLEVSIYRISYCSADATHGHVFAFIATNDNETLECHAFICPKRKIAQTMSLSVAQTFNNAYELWQLSQDRFTFPNKSGFSAQPNEKSIQIEPELHSNYINTSTSSHAKAIEAKTMLIDFNTEPRNFDPFSNGNNWVCFEDDNKSDIINNYSRSVIMEKPLLPVNNSKMVDVFDTSRWDHFRTKQACS